MKWIKIEDRLPRQYDTVLTYGHPNDEGVGITICTHSDGIFRFWESEKENKHTITHWAELPNTPKLEIDDRDISMDLREELLKYTDWLKSTGSLDIGSATLPVSTYLKRRLNERSSVVPQDTCTHKFVAIYIDYDISYLECLNCGKAKPY